MVDPVARGHGLGRRLMEALLEELRSRGAPRVVLEAAARNRRAQELFASLGFRPTMVELTHDFPVRATNGVANRTAGGS